MLSGGLRLVLGEYELVLTAGEAAEFDTGVPRWFGNAGTRTVEFLGLVGKQGERVHLRARPPPQGRPASGSGCACESARWGPREIAHTCAHRR